MNTYRWIGKLRPCVVRGHCPRDNGQQPSRPDDKLEIERLCGVVARLHKVLADWKQKADELNTRQQAEIEMLKKDRAHLLAELGATLETCALPSKGNV